jgi:diguanylate cyclase
VLWRYVRDDCHELSFALEAAMAHGSLDRAAVMALYDAYCAPAAQADAKAGSTAAEVSAIVKAAQDQAISLSQHLETSRNDVADYGRAIADGGAALERPLDSYGISALLGQLGTATAAMKGANERLENELAAAADNARLLGERLTAAECAASTDSLTGVLNRRGTLEKLALVQAESRAAGVPLSVAMFDIDHFKNFNDRFGHALGDKVLAFVASHVSERVGARGGSVGRLGGEEFIALLPGIDVMAASAIIDRVRAELACQIIRNAANNASLGRVTFSAGVSGDHPDDDCNSLVERADKALYAAKRMGRDRVVPDRS